MTTNFGKMRAVKFRTMSDTERLNRIPSNLVIIAMVTLTFANSIPGGRILTLAIFSMAIFVPLLMKRQTWHGSVLLVALVSCGYYLTIILAHQVTNASMYNGFLLVSCIIMAVSLSSVTPSTQSIDYFLRTASTTGKILLFLGVAHTLIPESFHWNSKSGFLFLHLFFVLVGGRNTRVGVILYSLLWSYIAYFHDDRAYLIALLVLILAKTAWPLLSKSRALSSWVLWAFFALLAVVPYFYVKLSTSTYRARLDSLALEYGDSRFFSGRDVIWSRMYGEMEGQILFGGGHEISPSTLLGMDLSAHNTYVALASRTGVIGTLLFFLFCLTLFYTYKDVKQDRVISWSAAYSFAILFKQSTEISLTGNNVSLAIPSWLVLCFGVIWLNSRPIDGGPGVAKMPPGRKK